VPQSLKKLHQDRQTNIRLTDSFQDDMGKPAPERLNQSGF